VDVVDELEEEAVGVLMYAVIGWVCGYDQNGVVIDRGTVGWMPLRNRVAVG
jgi:hypothetical protein